MDNGYEKQTFLRIVELVNELYGYNNRKQETESRPKDIGTSKVIPFSAWHISQQKRSNNEII